MKENYFKFTLSYKNFIISQTIENADSYSKDSFKMVNLRDFITPLIKDFQNVLSLKTSKMDSNFYGYDLIKYNEYHRYYLGLRTRMLILTIRNRYKRGFTIRKIFRNIKFFLRESIKKKELVGYYISIRGRYKKSSR